MVVQTARVCNLHKKYTVAVFVVYLVHRKAVFGMRKTEISSDMVMSANLCYSGSTAESMTKICSVTCIQEPKLNKSPHKILQDFLGLPFSNGVRLMPCLSAPNALIARAKRGRNALADV